MGSFALCRQVRFSRDNIYEVKLKGIHKHVNYIVHCSSSIDSLNQKLRLWNDFEEKKEECMNWLKDTDTKLHAVDLKPTLETKVEQLNELKTLQGEIKAKELEIDAISELALNLQRQVVTSKSNSGASSSDLTIKYQQISHKIKVCNLR